MGNMKFVLCVIGLAAMVAVAGVAQAAVIETQEWETMPGLPWSHNTPPVIDCAPTGGSSPSGSCALRMTYPAGTYSSSFGGGRLERSIATVPNELYVGHWNKYSSGFVFHPIGQKMDFFIFGPGSSNQACGFSNGTLGCTNQIIWGSGTTNHPCNMGGGCAEAKETNVWHWIEWRVKMNTPGAADGEFDLWIDDIQKAHYTNIQLNNTTESGGFKALQHTAEYGGGGSTLASTQYWWIDHTVISTTRIGRPGVGGSDTTAPATPTGWLLQ